MGANVDYWPDKMSDQTISHSLASLEAKGLVIVAWSSGMIPVASVLTGYGRAYLDSNPHLLNPVDWSKVGAIAAVISAIGVIIGLLVACVKL